MHVRQGCRELLASSFETPGTRGLASSPFYGSTPQTRSPAHQTVMRSHGDVVRVRNAPTGDATSVEDQMQLFEELTDADPDNGNADAIGIGCKDAVAMAPLITDAVERVPIITFDAEVDNPVATGRHLYLGAINLPAGREAGRALSSLVPVEGTVHLNAQSFAPINLLERAAGVFESCVDTTFESGSAFGQSEYCQDLETRHVCEAECTGGWSGFRMVAHAYQEELAADADWGSAHPDASAEDYLADCVTQLLDGSDAPTAIVSLHGTPGPAVHAALAEHEQGGGVPFVAWDLSDEVQAGLENGTVQAVIVQNSFFYGYLTAHIACAMAATDVPTAMEQLDPYFEPSTDDSLLDTGITVVTPTTLESFLDYQRDCLGIR